MTCTDQLRISPSGPHPRTTRIRRKRHRRALEKLSNGTLEIERPTTAGKRTGITQHQPRRRIQNVYLGGGTQLGFVIKLEFDTQLLYVRKTRAQRGRWGNSRPDGRTRRTISTQAWDRQAAVNRQEIRLAGFQRAFAFDARVSTAADPYGQPLSGASIAGSFAWPRHTLRWTAKTDAQTDFGANRYTKLTQ